MTAALFPNRRAAGPWPRSAEETPRFDRYLESRNRYKGELIDELAAAVTGGPVLEAGSGLGAVGVELLRRTTAPLVITCESRHAVVCQADRLRREGLADRCRLTLDEHEPDGEYELVYSVNNLHEWPRPGAVLTRLHGSARRGGLVVVNDLRRDADPFITEYVLRELADGTEEGRYRAGAFVHSLAAAYSLDEVRDLVAGLGFRHAEIDGDAMTVTVRLRKEV